MRTTILTLALVAALAGCSPTKQIAKEVQATGESIASARDHLARARSMIEDQPAPFAEVTAADADLASAQARLARVPTLLTETTDKVSPWLTWLTWGAIATVLVVVLVILWRTGLLGLIGAWVASLRAGLSPTVSLQGQAVAKLEAGTLTPAEYAASYRATSPTNNAAFAKGKAKLEPKESVK